MNLYAIRAIYIFEMSRTFRTLFQSICAPVITTSLYFIVFGSAIGSRMTQIGGVPYGAFIVPGLCMLSILTESISNSSFGIYMPKWSGTIYEVHSAPISALEIVIGYVGATGTAQCALGRPAPAAPKSQGLSNHAVDLRVLRPEITVAPKDANYKGGSAIRTIQG